MPSANAGKTSHHGSMDTACRMMLQASAGDTLEECVPGWILRSYSTASPLKMPSFRVALKQAGDAMDM